MIFDLFNVRSCGVSRARVCVCASVLNEPKVRSVEVRLLQRSNNSTITCAYVGPILISERLIELYVIREMVLHYCEESVHDIFCTKCGVRSAITATCN